jgi:N-acetylglucosaminyl-diphospho-decaprenol L-rhamnosyltransferase
MVEFELASTTDVTPGETAGDARTRVDCAVVVVTYNSADDIGGLLASLPAATEGLNVRCIVVDNGSVDTTVEVASGVAGVVCIETGRNLGYAGGVNVGRAYARPYASLLILNPDVRLEPGCVTRLWAALKDPRVGITVPRMADGSGKLFYSLRREPSVSRAVGDALFGNRFPGRPSWFSEVVRNHTSYSSRASFDWAGGAALLISASCDEAVDAWDEDRFFLYSEETDVAARARDAGFRIDYIPEARVRHLGGRSGQSDSLVALAAVNRIRYYEKRHGQPWRVLFRFAVVLHELLRVKERAHRGALAAVLRRSTWARLPGGRPGRTGGRL